MYVTFVVCTVPLQHFCDRVTLIFACIIIIIIIIITIKSNIQQVAKLLRAHTNSVSYSLRNGKQVLAQPVWAIRSGQGLVWTGDQRYICWLNNMSSFPLVEAMDNRFMCCNEITRYWLAKNPTEFWHKKFGKRIDANVTLPGCQSDQETAEQFASHFTAVYYPFVDDSVTVDECLYKHENCCQ